jgi:hypothetical protein
MFEVFIEHPKFSAGMSLSQEKQPDIHFTFKEEVPKDIMDRFQQLVGNALARVSVSKDMGIKDFGTGASAMVTVSLTCNQDETTVAQAAELAAGAAGYYVNKFRSEAEGELQHLLEQRKLPPGVQTRPNYG